MTQELIKTDIRLHSQLFQQTFYSFKKNLEVQLKQQFGEINRKFSNQESTNKILLEKIVGLQNQNFKLNEALMQDNGLLGQQVLINAELVTKIKALEKYHKVEWTVNHDYIKIKGKRNVPKRTS